MRFVKFIAKSILVIFALVGGFVVLGILAIGLAWRSLPGVTAPAPPSNTVLTFDLADGLTEAAPDSPLSFAGFDKSVTMRDAVRAIEAAAKDDRVKVLLLHLGRGDLDLAHAQELGDAVADFRKSGKFALAFAESFGESGSAGSHYLLATSATEIWLQPSGDLQLVGVALQSPFFRGLFDKLGVVTRMARREEYKGAVNSFTDDSMPAPQRANMQALADSWVAQLANAIAKNRHIDPALARQLIDRGPYGAAAAKAAGLIDVPRYWDEALAAAVEHAGPGARTFTFGEYVAGLPEPVKGTPRIAVVYGVGEVVLGKGENNPLFGNVSMGSQTLADALHRAVDDPAIAAIILRIDSPGGSYVAADAIWREVKRAKDKGKPLVVSMAGVAASGGYFVAAPAAAIVAEPATITGSIGVFGGKFIIKDLLAKIGVTLDGVSSGTNALIDGWAADYTPAQWALLEAELDRIYSDFLDKVAQGRSMSKEAVRAVAKGQIWSGLAAKENGLVDRLGGLLTAVDLLRPLAKIGPDAPVFLEQYPDSNDRLQAALVRLMGIGGNTEFASPLTRFLKIVGPLLSAIDTAAGLAPDERLRAPLP